MKSAEVRQEEQLRFAEYMRAVAEQRDKRAFEKLFDHFVPLLRSFSLAAQPGASLLADEVAQEVMIKVWQKAHTYNKEMANVTTWIFTLARNSRIDYLRKNSRHESDIDPTNLWGEIVDENSDPFQAAQQKRSEELISKQLKGLPEDQQNALRKVYLEGKTHKQVAEELKLPLGTVKSRVRLALRKLAISIPR
ncbi:RNA polymerase sigma-70 factor, ECF subfamily [Alteromonadaceae bacterium Bs31]|nr:RNA polymerase sigma-70 factor, ECF subfamily [Alteromonadaceae bacterium Bs31]